MEQYRKSPRATFLDYESGNYFITICTRDRKHYFGEIENAEMHFSEIGKFAELQLCKAKEFNSKIDVPLYVVMPNHIHLIVSICRDKSSTCEIIDIEQRSPNPFYRANSTCQRHVPTLSRYISTLKGAVTKFARSCNLEFGWQTRYHDHYIRGNRDANKISEYILNNVANWHYDCFYKDEIQIQDTTVSD